MGVHESAHPGQRLASERRTASTTDRTCTFCGATVPEDDSERVEHVLPAGSDTRRELYCNPGCFVQQMNRIGSPE